MLYHEAAHIEVSDAVFAAIEAELQATHRSPDLQLWHAVHFYTVGESVKEVLKSEGNLDYQTYADENGVYTRGDWPILHSAIVTSWRPYMHGEIGLQQAVKAMVQQLPPP